MIIQGAFLSIKVLPLIQVFIFCMIEQQIPDGKEIRNIVKFLRESKVGLITKM
jgi:hypothetical protein